MVEVMDAKQSDIDYIMENPINGVFKNYPRTLLSGKAKTAVINGDIIAVGGIVVYWPGVGEVWALISKDAEQHKLRMILCIRTIMNRLIEENNIRRLEATARVDFPQAIKMLESLGFEYEGLKRGYLPDGTDALMYGLLR